MAGCLEAILRASSKLVAESGICGEASLLVPLAPQQRP